MITQETIDRINELAHKSKKEGLTPAEKEEQKKLRQEYIEAIRGNIRSQLDNVDILEADGTTTHLSDVRKKHMHEK